MFVAQSTRRPGGTLYRYIAREMALPTLATLGGFTLVVLIQDLIRSSELIINRGLSADVVDWIAFYQTVPLAARTLPFAVLVGSMIALGRMGADRELLALEASGFSVRRLVAPAVLFATVMAAIGLALSVLAAPAASRAVDAAYMQLLHQNPAAMIRPGIPHSFGNWRLEAREVSPDGRQLEGVVLFIPDVGETIFARSAQILAPPDGRIVLQLEDGALMPDPRVRPREVRFDRLEVKLPKDAMDDFERDDEDILVGATIPELIAQGRDETLKGDDALEAQVELQRRFALPLASLVFGFLSLPLFLSRAQFSRSGGAMLGVVATLGYYGLVQLGNGLIEAELVTVVVGVWLPNAFVALVAGILLVGFQRTSAFGRHLAESQGGTRRMIDRTTRALTAFLSRRGRSQTGPGRSDGHVRVRRWALQRYIAGLFLQMVVLCFTVLLTAYLIVDVLERLQWFAKHGAEGGEILRFYGARIPLLASRVVPMSLLVGTALTVGLLAVQGELMAIQSCGISALRALTPALVICGAVAPASFYLTDNIVPRTNALADYLKQTEIKKADDDRLEARRRRDVWSRSGRRFFEAERFDPKLGAARNITVYELGDDGLPRTRADARGGRHIGGGVWRMVEPFRVERSSAGITTVPAATFAELGEEISAEVDTMHLSVRELRGEIRDVQEGGYDSTVYEVDLFMKLAAPFACLVLPALLEAEQALGC